MARLNSFARAILFALLIAVSVVPADTSHAALSYAVSTLPTPVFNTASFSRLFGGNDGASVVTDQCGQFRQLEFIALPGTVFEIEESLAGEKGVVYRVSTKDYPYPTASGYFIDARFVTQFPSRPPERLPVLPSRQEVVARLLKAEGSIYVWGGNIREGIPQMKEFYPPRQGAALNSGTDRRWQLRGVDCSGLLYGATDGFTPRNTSTLVNYGQGVPVAGLTSDQIVSRLEPLDLVVWNGHVLIVLDRERLIESYLDCNGNGGVRVRPLRQAIESIAKKRKPLDRWDSAGNGFVIRRWYPEGKGRG